MSGQVITKRCSKCKNVKSISEFYRVKATRSGLHSWCKECVKKCVDNYQHTNGYEICKGARKRYRQTEKGRHTERASTHRHHIKYKEKELAYRKAYESHYPEKAKAKQAVRVAIRQGRLKKVTTQICHCSKQAKHYHHHKGYKPEHWLDVIPLCCSCHKKTEK